MFKGFILIIFSALIILQPIPANGLPHSSDLLRPKSTSQTISGEIKKELDTQGADLGAQVAHLKNLDNLLRILNVLRKSEKLPELSEHASDSEIVEYCLDILKKQDMLEEINHAYNLKVVIIKQDALGDRIAQAIKKYAVDTEGGVKAINYKAKSGIWKIVVFEGDLTQDVLDHEMDEVWFRKERGYDWVKAHNEALVMHGRGERVERDEALKYQAGRHDDIGAGSSSNYVTQEQMEMDFEDPAFIRLAEMLKRFADGKRKPSIVSAPDLHGNVSTLSSCIGSAVKTIGSENFRNVDIGDSFDRDSQNLAVFEYLKYFNTDGKLEKLIGNHELIEMLGMMGNDIALKAWLDAEMGGFATWQEMNKLSKNVSIFVTKDDKELFEAVRKDKHLKKMVKWLKANCKLYYVDPYGLLYMHAGIPLNKDGTHKLYYKGYRGLFALAKMEQEMREAFKNGDYNADVFRVLDAGENGLLWVRDWIDIARDNEEAFNKTLDELGITGVVYGHTMQNFRATTGRIFGLEIVNLRAADKVFLIRHDRDKNVDLVRYGGRDVILGDSADARQKAKQMLSAIESTIKTKQDISDLVVARETDIQVGDIITNDFADKSQLEAGVVKEINGNIICAQANTGKTVDLGPKEELLGKINGSGGFYIYRGNMRIDELAKVFMAGENIYKDQEKAPVFVYSNDMLTNEGFARLIPSIAQKILHAENAQLILAVRGNDDEADDLRRMLEAQKKTLSASFQKKVVIKDESEVPSILMNLKGVYRTYFRTENEPNLLGVDTTRVIELFTLKYLEKLYKDDALQFEELEREIAGQDQA